MADDNALPPTCLAMYSSRSVVLLYTHHVCCSLAAQDPCWCALEWVTMSPPARLRKVGTPNIEEYWRSS